MRYPPPTIEETFSVLPGTAARLADAYRVRIEQEIRLQIREPKLMPRWLFRWLMRYVVIEETPLRVSLDR